MSPAPPIVRRLAGSLAAALLLAAMFALQSSASPHTSAVVDEPVHLTAGYLALTRGDLSVNKEHPPLMKELAALPLLALHPVLPPPEAGGPKPGTEDYEFDYARRFLYRANDADRLLRLARVPVMMLTILLGAVVFVWTRELAGTLAALGALAMYAFEPDILAHGRLVTTDLGAAAFTLAFVWTLRMVARRGSPVAAAACGLMLGAALLTKFSTLLLLPAGAVLLLVDRRLACGEEDTRPSAARLANMAGIVLLVAWIALLAGYKFGGFPVPPLYLKGLELARIKNVSVEGPTYLMGSISPDGFWSYYFVAILVKTPIPLLILSIAGFLAWLAPKRLRMEALWVLLPAAIWLGATTLVGRAQLGIRYVLPVIPFMCVAGGLAIQSALEAASRMRAGAAAAVRVALAGLLVWQAAGTIRIHPYHLAYFNAIAGGPDRGWKWLVDSNLDWGQDLVGLHDWLLARGNPEVNLYYFGTADPDYYGIRRRPYGSPAPGLFAISVTHLAGVYLPDHDLLAAFRTMTPVTRIGHSIFVYRVDQVPEKLRAAAARPAPRP